MLIGAEVGSECEEVNVSHKQKEGRNEGSITPIKGSGGSVRRELLGLGVKFIYGL